MALIHGDVAREQPVASFSDVYWRAYFRVAALPILNDFNRLIEIADTAYGGNVRAGIHTDAVGNPEWFLGNPLGNTFFPAAIVANQWYCVEIRRKVGNGDGVMTMWVDGVQIINSTTETFLLNAQFFDVGLCFAGGNDYTTFADDVALATVGPIGPASSNTIITEPVTTIVEQTTTEALAVDGARVRTLRRITNLVPAVVG